MRSQSLLARSLAALAIAVALVASRAALGQQPTLEDDPDVVEILNLLGHSKPDLDGQCEAGRTEILEKLDALRADPRYRHLFDDYDYGPVNKTEPAGHHGVAFYRKREAGQSYEDAIKTGIVIDYTNYWSQWTGNYRVRPWNEWRWFGLAGDGEIDRSKTRYKDYYWNENGPRYPDPAIDSGGGGVNPIPHAPEPPIEITINVDFAIAFDPNDKAGPAGAGEERWVGGEEPLGYTVFFENLPEASAPAQEVVVTDRLDVAGMDLDTLALGDIAFGDRRVEIPPGTSEFSTQVDLRPERELLVRIEVTLDRVAGELVWRFTSLDPATNQPPEDPLAGFLPPNLIPPEGEGRVTFSVMPMAGLGTGSEVRNQASIVFDTNPPIETPEWRNTIDVTAPESAVTGVTVAPCGQTIGVEWGGTDAGAGVHVYDIYVAENDGPFALWQASRTTTRASFIGRWGSTYSFYAVARDLAGNVETPPAAPDASATIAECGAHDLAIVKIASPRNVALSARRPARNARIAVILQNRGAALETIPDLDALQGLVELSAQPLGGCPTPTPVLLGAKPGRRFPLALKPKRSLRVSFDVPIGCASDPAASTPRDPGHEDYALAAALDFSVLGGLDAHADDDVCPRTVAPPGPIDPFPDGTIRDKGCGAKRADRTFGDPVLLDVRVRP